MSSKIYLQITSGRGPAECCRVVALVLERIMEQARKAGLNTEVLEREQGVINRTLFSATLSIEGKGCEDIVKEWEGTIQWIAQSPYRIYHKRKNWFIGLNSFIVPDIKDTNEKEIEYQTLRASGPGGQHVNKTESAVRAIHTPSGLSVTASDQRSQLQNKKLATKRLLIKLAAWNIEQSMQAAQKNWNNHNNLQRGNPVKVIQESLN
ncbi:peptide chain release factor [Dysgonomonas alginatilytica]|uniref:Peptide chain release factor n=1 Tax=Dysgonomonas alginatilytica TaxID=1605892 RepID=A0A2V3PRC2_9BACT|nr:peptide chain release factor H [Dysgonomonas alginatilytica]PXV66937.1 peptide chain release factor [Dysgonomonas alginatilytica]